MNLITPEFGLIFWQTVVFLLILFLLSKYAWKPIMEMIKEREDHINDSLEEAAKARAEMEKLTADNENILAEARRERDKIILDAKDAANKMVAEAKEKAKDEGKRELNEAKEAIRNEKMNAITEIKNMVGDLSVEIAEKILTNKLDSQDGHKDLVDAYLSKVKLN